MSGSPARRPAGRGRAPCARASRCSARVLAQHVVDRRGRRQSSARASAARIASEGRPVPGRLRRAASGYGHEAAVVHAEAAAERGRTGRTARAKRCGSGRRSAAPAQAETARSFSGSATRRQVSRRPAEARSVIESPQRRRLAIAAWNCRRRGARAAARAAGGRAHIESPPDAAVPRAPPEGVYCAPRRTGLLNCPFSEGTDDPRLQGDTAEAGRARLRGRVRPGDRRRRARRGRQRLDEHRGPGRRQPDPHRRPARTSRTTASST